MGKRPKRKVILFLVEGKSDREALRLAIPELYDEIDEDFEVFFPTIREADEEIGGDVTSKIGVYPRNIEDKIYNLFLKDFFDEEKIFPKDITEIVQIVDTDGAYIPDECVMVGENPDGSDKPYYSDTGIICTNPTRIVKRNECKRENLDYLSSLEKIKVRQKSVPYRIYFFSCNLDHYLHHSANLDYRMKRTLAATFSKSYISDVRGFVKEISDDPGATSDMSYEESWRYIKEGMNSISRHTNLNLLFDRLASEDAE